MAKSLDAVRIKEILDAIRLVAPSVTVNPSKWVANLLNPSASIPTTLPSTPQPVDMSTWISIFEGASDTTKAIYNNHLLAYKLPVPVPDLANKKGSFALYKNKFKINPTAPGTNPERTALVAFLKTLKTLTNATETDAFKGLPT